MSEASAPPESLPFPDIKKCSSYDYKGPRKFIELSLSLDGRSAFLYLKNYKNTLPENIDQIYIHLYSQINAPPNRFPAYKIYCLEGPPSNILPLKILTGEYINNPSLITAADKSKLNKDMEDYLKDLKGS